MLQNNAHLIVTHDPLIACNQIMKILGKRRDRSNCEDKNTFSKDDFPTEVWSQLFYNFHGWIFHSVKYEHVGTVPRRMSHKNDIP